MDIKEKMRQVPFGNSVFQIQHFVANQESPERTYRNVLLQYNQKMKSMKECSFRRKRKEIDIEEINEKIRKIESEPTVDQEKHRFEKERLFIDLEEAQFYLDEEIKLIEDCIIEIKTYEDIIKNLPEFTREEFEKSEREYWKVRLIKSSERELLSRGTIGEGNLQALEQIGCPVIRKDGNFVITDDVDPVASITNNTENKVTENTQ